MTATSSLENCAKHDEQPQHARHVRLAIGIVASILYLIIRTHIPIAVHAEALHDDQLFISMGQRIADGHWLGAYNQMTLIKGPGYPLFLAANAWLGTPISLTEAAFLGLAIGVFFLVFACISRMPNVALFGYIATLWMPAPYLERIMRDCIYPGQMLLVLSGLIALLYIEMARNWRYTCALATGLLLGWFSLTREEGIWIAPGIAVIALAATIHYQRKQQARAFVLAPVALIIAAYGVTQLTFLSINRIAYGSFIGVEVTSSPFSDAMSALQSVQAGKQIPYVPVSKQAREAIYQVSPSFLKLKGYLDPPTGSLWQFGCQFYAETCGEIAGGWFMWALREAVATNGFYDSPKKAAAFYRRLTNEVQEACRAGQLQCKPLLISMVPRIAASQWANAPASLLHGLRMVTLYTPNPVNILSSGSAADLRADMEFLGSPARTSSPSDINLYSIHGWYYGAGKKGWVTGKITSGNETATLQVVRADSPDLVRGAGTPDASHQRFNTIINCQAPCIYSFVDDVGATVDIHLAEAAGHPSSYPLNGATLNIDQVSESSISSINANPRYRLAAAWGETMEKTYGHVLPWLLPLSLLAMSAALVISLRRRALAATTVLAMTLWVLFAARLALLTLVDISSFPAMIVPYLSPAYVLACITPIISFAALYELLKPSDCGGRS